MEVIGLQTLARLAARIHQSLFTLIWPADCWVKALEWIQDISFGRRWK